jgi:S-disulfanyl-L-cysteine oxidoreductase SoxD
MTTAHGFMRRDGKPDTRNVACMKNCAAVVRLISELPDPSGESRGGAAERSRALAATR